MNLGPFWSSFLDLRSISHYQEVVARSGIEVGRVFRMEFVWHYIVWLFAALVFWKQGGRICRAASAIFVAAIISLNIQLFTGFVPQPDHFLRYPLALALWISFTVLGIVVWEKYRYVFSPLKNYLLFCLFAAAALVLIRNIQLPFAYANYNFHRYAINALDYEALGWIRNNIQQDSVVLSPSVVTNAHLLIFTPAKVFVPSSGLITVASDREIIERYVVAAKLFGASEDEIRRRFSYKYISVPESEKQGVEENIALHLFHYGLYSQEPGTYFRGNKIRPLDDLEVMIENVLTDWKENSTRLLNKYEVGYIYAGSSEKISFPFCVEVVYSNEAVTIYKKCNGK